jgi:hypothetical protein
MINLSDWNLYWNLEGSQLVRANLVYTAYVSPDRKNFCQWFFRDSRYHHDPTENSCWTDELLEDRFNREIKFHDRARKHMPTLPIVDIDQKERKVVYEWPGDDFLMQSIYAGGREKLLPDWQDQMTLLIHKMKKSHITKLSLHPNSWTVMQGTLVPFNWFFSYDSEKDTDSFENLLIQISQGRMEKLEPILTRLNIDKTREYPVEKLQIAALESFRANYDNDLIDRILTLL